MKDVQKPDRTAREETRWNPWGSEEPLNLEGKQDFLAFMEKHLRDYLQSFSRKELREKIRNFKDINFKNLGYKEIGDAVHKVLAMGNSPNGPVSVFPMENAKYPKGTKFYRVRKFSNGKNPVSTVPDCWYPPPKDTKMGRVNLAGKPILYTSPINPTIAAEEMGLMDGSPFVLLEYEANKDVHFGWITYGTASFDSVLNEEELGKLDMLRDFLFDEFTRVVGDGTEYLYRITNVIAETYFNYPDSSGYCYPSIARREGCWNTSFFPEQAKVNLVLTGINQFRIWGIGKPEILVKRDARFRIADNGVDIIRWE